MGPLEPNPLLLPLLPLLALLLLCRLLPLLLQHPLIVLLQLELLLLPRLRHPLLPLLLLLLERQTLLLQHGEERLLLGLLESNALLLPLLPLLALLLLPLLAVSGAQLLQCLPVPLLQTRRLLLQHPPEALHLLLLLLRRLLPLLLQPLLQHPLIVLLQLELLLLPRLRHPLLPLLPLLLLLLERQTLLLQHGLLLGSLEPNALLLPLLPLLALLLLLLLDQPQHARFQHLLQGLVALLLQSGPLPPPLLCEPLRQCLLLLLGPQLRLLQPGAQLRLVVQAPPLLFLTRPLLQEPHLQEPHLLLCAPPLLLQVRDLGVGLQEALPQGGHLLLLLLPLQLLLLLCLPPLQAVPLQPGLLQLALEEPGPGLEAGHLLPEGPDLLLVPGGGGGLLALVGRPLLLHPAVQLLDLRPSEEDG